MWLTQINCQRLNSFTKGGKEVKKRRVRIQGAPQGPKLLHHRSNPTIVFFSASGQNEYVEGSSLGKSVCIFPK